MSTTAEKIAELKDNVATLEAFERGESTQWQRGDGTWSDDKDPLGSVEVGLRIRVKPKPREWWIWTDGNNALGTLYTDQQAKRMRESANSKFIHVREVIEPC